MMKKTKKMKLTDEEKKICKKYGKRDKDYKVHCYECPLAIDTRYCICKANVTEEEYREWKGEENE